MSRRPLMQNAVAKQSHEDVTTQMRDDVNTTSRDNVTELPTRSKQGVRHNSYRLGIYLPKEAEYPLKEIALAQRCKIHDLVTEAVAQILERNNAAEVAKLVRSRDKVNA